MVKFTEDAISKDDQFFVDEDPARIYRGLKDLLVDEFDMDRVEEKKNEFNVAVPEDDFPLHAFKEKSPNTVIHYELEWTAKDPKDFYKWERHDDVMKAEVTSSAEVVTIFPGWGKSTWNVNKVSHAPHQQFPDTFLRTRKKTRFKQSKLYELMAGAWYHYFYKSEIETYRAEARHTVKRIHNIMRERFGVEEAIIRTDRSQYQPPWG